jgi:hypothetical protein
VKNSSRNKGRNRRGRGQRETEERIETSFLFSQQASPRVKPLFERDGFLFPR